MLSRVGLRVGTILAVLALFGAGTLSACSPKAMHPIDERTICEVALGPGVGGDLTGHSLTECETVNEWTSTATSHGGEGATQIGSLVRLTLTCAEPQWRITPVCLDLSSSS